MGYTTIADSVPISTYGGELVARPLRSGASPSLPPDALMHPMRNGHPHASSSFTASMQPHSYVFTPAESLPQVMGTAVPAFLQPDITGGVQYGMRVGYEGGIIPQVNYTSSSSSKVTGGDASKSHSGLDGLFSPTAQYGSSSTMPTYVRNAVEQAPTIPAAYLAGEGNSMLSYIPQTFQAAFMTLDMPPASFFAGERQVQSPTRSAARSATPGAGTGAKRIVHSNPANADPASPAISPPVTKTIQRPPMLQGSSPGSSLHSAPRTSPPPPRRTPSTGPCQRSPSGHCVPPPPAPTQGCIPATPPGPRPQRPNMHIAEAQTLHPPNSTASATQLSPQHLLPPEVMQLDFESDLEVEGLDTDDDGSLDEKAGSEMLGGASDGDVEPVRELAVTPVDSQDSRGEYSPDSEAQLLPSAHGERRRSRTPKTPAIGKARPRPQAAVRTTPAAKGAPKARSASSKAKAASRVQENQRAPQPRNVAKKASAHPRAAAEPQPKEIQVPLTTWADAATNTPPQSLMAGGPGVRFPHRIPTPLSTALPSVLVPPAVSAPPALGHSFPNDVRDLGPPAMPAAVLARIAEEQTTEVIKSAASSPTKGGNAPRRSSGLDSFDFIPQEAFPKLKELSTLLKALQKNSMKIPCRRARPGFKRPCYQSLHKARFQSLCPSDNSVPAASEPVKPLPAAQATLGGDTAKDELPPPLYSRLPLSPFGGKVLEQVGSRRFCCSAASMNGQRPSMEDAHGWWLGETMGVFGVFDGHAGRGCSHFISREFPPQVAGCGPSLDLDTLECVCLDLDERFITNLNDDSGCTAAFCVAIPLPSGNFKLHVGNIGDARVLVGRQGAVLHATDDHKPTLPSEAKRIQQCGGWVDFGSGRIDGLLAVSRAFGDRRFKAGGPLPTQQKVIAQPALSTVVCEPDDFVLVACDGIFERDFSNDQVVRFVWEALAKSGDAGLACAALCEEALRRGSGDNMTAMVVQFREGAGRRVTPLPPPFVMGDHLAMAFEIFTKEAGITFGQALQARRDLLAEELSEPRVQAYPPELVQGMHAELSFFGPAPGPSVPPQRRDEWFDRLATFYHMLRQNPHNPQLRDPREDPFLEVEEMPDQAPSTPFRRMPSRIGEQRSDPPAMGRASLQAEAMALTSPTSPAARANPLPSVIPREHPESSSYVPRKVPPVGLRGIYDA
eukprot:GGOE01006779.1.p1 GENE.GGOE01006779.1~~GGOE01006779.1.p1  ORF type:complete len:1338 (+),score=225.28 GGOE01006779.1:481-4014(+)